MVGGVGFGVFGLGFVGWVLGLGWIWFGDGLVGLV